MMEFISSGFLVVGMPKYINGTLYCGVDTQVFPVEYVGLNIINSTEYKQSLLDTGYAFFLDYTCASDYYLRCKNENDNVRILFCESTVKGCQFSLSENDINKVSFLGYDYTYPSGDYYSTIANEILYSCFPESTKWRSFLNQFGLFNSMQTVEKYLVERNYHKQQSDAAIYFESGDFCIMRVYELGIKTGEDLKGQGGGLREPF